MKAEICRKPEIPVSGMLAQKVYQQEAELTALRETVQLMDRKLSKMQSRVLICAEQFRTVRRSNDEIRMLATGSLATQGAALADVQEQANRLQMVVSSLQDVVVKQIEVGLDIWLCNRSRRELSFD
jgi:hypothetical protein